jgi:hypothetical protein
MTRWIGLVLVGAATGGCSDRGPERVVVSGTVTHNGQPVPEGTIRFDPVQTSLVPGAGAAIKDGRYTVDVHGGVPAGTHRIRIEALRQIKAPPGSPFAHGLKQYIPKKYNDNTQLTISVESGCPRITKDFALTD